MGITVTAPQAATAVTAALDTAAGVIVATGTSDAIEAGTGRNPIRDDLLGGNQGAYDTVKGVTHMAAGYGIAMGMPPLAAQRYAEEHMPKEAFTAGTKNSVIQVTPDGVALPKNRAIPSSLVQNPYRAGSYGTIDEDTGKFKEILRIDPATPEGYKGPQYSHYHINNSKEHFAPGHKDDWPWQ